MTLLVLFTGACSSCQRRDAARANETERSRNGGERLKFDRIFSAESPFNTPIPASATVDPNSRTMMNSLLEDARRKGIKIAWSFWSVPVYLADANTPRYTVSFNRFSFGGYHYLDGVPIPDHAQPAAPDACQSGTDGHMTIIDQTNNCMYDFFEACKQPDGSWIASWANRMYTTDSGIYPQGASTRGSGFANLLGLMTPAEFHAGVINHALMFSSGVNRSSGPVAPATESDGSNAGSQYIPEGARIRLKASFDLSGYPGWLQVIGQALKTYGAFNGDSSGGGFNLYAVDANRSDVPYRGTYPWGGTKYPAIPIEFIENMEVLTLGPQIPSQANPLQQPCAKYR